MMEGTGLNSKGASVLYTLTPLTSVPNPDELIKHDSQVPHPFTRFPYRKQTKRKQKYNLEILLLSSFILHVTREGRQSFFARLLLVLPQSEVTLQLRATPQHESSDLSRCQNKEAPRLCTVSLPSAGLKNEHFKPRLVPRCTVLCKSKLK